MNSGDSAQDASRTGPLQDIQEIIDKLAIVTQQLRRPKSVAATTSADR